MAATITDLANGGGAGFNTTMGTGATVTGTVADKDWFVVLIAINNEGAGGTALGETVADSGGTNVYTQQAIINYTPTATISDGATLAIFTCELTANITSGTITVTHSSATTHKVVQVYRVRPGAGETVTLVSVDTTGSTGSATTYSAATVSVTSGDIIFGAAAIETDDAVTGDSDTTNGSWSTIITRLLDGGQDASCMTCSSQYKTVTGTGNQDWGPTTASARDSARTYLILRSSASGNKTIDATTGGSYALTGTNVSIPLFASAGSYAMAGIDATLRRNLPMVADAGSYAITGQDVTLTKATFNKTLAVDPASYDMTGATDSTPKHDWIIVAEPWHP